MRFSLYYYMHNISYYDKYMYILEVCVWVWASYACAHWFEKLSALGALCRGAEGVGKTFGAYDVNTSWRLGPRKMYVWIIKNNKNIINNYYYLSSDHRAQYTTIFVVVVNTV